MGRKGGDGELKEISGFEVVKEVKEVKEAGAER